MHLYMKAVPHRVKHIQTEDKSLGMVNGRTMLLSFSQGIGCYHGRSHCLEHCNCFASVVLLVRFHGCTFHLSQQLCFTQSRIVNYTQFLFSYSSLPPFFKPIKRCLLSCLMQQRKWRCRSAFTAPSINTSVRSPCISFPGLIIAVFVISPT